MEENGKVLDNWRTSLLSRLPHVQLTTGVVLTMLMSLVVSAPALMRVGENDELGPRFDLEPGSLETATELCGPDPQFRNENLKSPATTSDLMYRLFIYIYFHEDFSSLACSFLMIWYFGGGFEENVGTAKFWLLTPVFAVSSGLLYLAILATGLSWQANVTVQGFTSVAFAMLSVFTTRSFLRRMLFFGFMVPTKVLPLFFLVLALFLPHAPVLNNVCGILVGIAYGMSGCFCLGLPESIMSRIDHTFPCRLLKRIPIWTYVPGSSAERNAAQSRKINPPPGSYPTQQYYTPPQGLHDAYSPYHNLKPTGNWPPSMAPAGPSSYSTTSPPGAYQKPHTCSGGHSHLNTSTSTTIGGASVPPGNDLQQVRTQ